MAHGPLVMSVNGILVGLFQVSLVTTVLGKSRFMYVNGILVGFFPVSLVITLLGKSRFCVCQ